ncbi:uncharacterized protein F5Z01DRAFT_674111 [Emericellopsis atlantica]|uniref:Uncharacterized protein n=1 Tax=Emericellopsis atlantica TaxID=2614577 RepID=A0A9P7ZLS5_9HYPO|nr:uncharacterized protein F5Z01DRAFT_674111 [Emericellopsis atlantica]KAG9254365.1 hypothetical protein F5Z01DRAFT_674111 [Emericellopsis atlantica]
MDNHRQPYDDGSQQVNNPSFDDDIEFFQQVDDWSSLGSFDFSAPPDFPTWLEDLKKEMAQDSDLDNVAFMEPLITFDAPNQTLHPENFAPKEIRFPIDDPAWWESDNACRDGQGPPTLDSHHVNETQPQQFPGPWTYTDPQMECLEANRLFIINQYCLGQGEHFPQGHEATTTIADALPPCDQDNQRSTCYSPSTVGGESMNPPSGPPSDTPSAGPSRRPKRKASFDLNEVPQAINRLKKPKIYHGHKDPKSDTLLQHINAGVVPNPCPVTFESPADFNANLARLQEMYWKRTQECSFPCGALDDDRNADKTFPQSEEDYIHYVGLIKNAILDWTRYIEWMQCVPRETKQKRSAELVAKIEAHEALKKKPNSGIPTTANALETPDLIPPDDIVLPRLDEQHKHLLGRGCNALVAECLSWQLVQAAESHVSFERRIIAVAYVLRISKQVLKSVMTLGDGWIRRVANNPMAELNQKIDNQRCNLKKGRDFAQAAKHRANNGKGKGKAEALGEDEYEEEEEL